MARGYTGGFLEDQRLRLRGSREFDTVESYQAFIDGLIEERNTGREVRLAEELGVSLGVIAKRVHRGRRRVVAYLREEIAAYCETNQAWEDELAYLARLLPASG